MNNIITVDNFAALFDCTPVDRASDSMMPGPDLKLCILFVGTGALSSVACLTGAQLMIFFCYRFPVFLALKGFPTVTQHVSLLSPRLCFFIVLFVYRDDSLTS